MACTSQIYLSKGFSLIELITVVAVLIITFGIAIPGFSSLLSRNQQTTSINQFATALAQARYYAINHGSRVVLCPSSNLSTCTGGYEWQQGYITFVDNDHNRQRDPEDSLVAAFDKHHPSVNIRTSTGRRIITFHSSGRAPGSNTTIRFCSNNIDLPGKALILSNTGRARLSKKLSSGEEIPCDFT